MPSETRWLEVETEFGGEGAGGDVVCPRESGEEVIERVLVGEVDSGEPQAPLLLVAAEEVIDAKGSVEQTPRSDARRIVVVVLGVGGRDRKQAGGGPVRYERIRRMLGSLLTSQWVYLRSMFRPAL